MSLNITPSTPGYNVASYTKDTLHARVNLQTVPSPKGRRHLNYAFNVKSAD